MGVPSVCRLEELDGAVQCLAVRLCEVEELDAESNPRLCAHDVGADLKWVDR